MLGSEWLSDLITTLRGKNRNVEVEDSTYGFFLGIVLAVIGFLVVAAFLIVAVTH